MRAEPILAVLFLIAFFLPWIDVGYGAETISGFDILRVTFQLNDAAQPYGSIQDLGDGWLLYVFYAIPVGGILTLVFGLAGILARLFALLTGLAPWVIAVYLAVKAGDSFSDLTQVLAFGAYGTLLIGLLLILAGIGVIRTTPRA